MIFLEYIILDVTMEVMYSENPILLNLMKNFYLQTCNQRMKW